MLSNRLATALLILACAACKSESVATSGKTSTTGESAPADSDANPPGNTEAPQGDTPAADTPETPQNMPPAVEAGVFPQQWIHGSANCANNQDPPLQVHAYNAGLKILRQNKCLNFEGPFIYLLLGRDKAMLIDTGATASAQTFPLQVEVEKLITAHLAGKPRADYQLIVVHSHGHGDHVAADPQFRNQPGTTVVASNAQALQTFFKIANWATDTATYDLGGRPLTIIPIPGHEANHIAIHDPNTGILFTGDTLYPGMIFVSDWAALRTSADRLQKYAAGKPITHVLGAHVEMTSTPRVEYPYTTTFQPNEHVLQLKPSHLKELDDALKAIGPTPRREVHDSFIIDP